MNELLPGENWEEHVLRRELAMITLEGLRHRGEVPSVIQEKHATRSKQPALEKQQARD